MRSLGENGASRCYTPVSRRWGLRTVLRGVRKDPSYVRVCVHVGGGAQGHDGARRQGRPPRASRKAARSLGPCRGQCPHRWTSGCPSVWRWVVWGVGHRAWGSSGGSSSPGLWGVFSLSFRPPLPSFLLLILHLSPGSYPPAPHMSLILLRHHHHLDTTAPLTARLTLTRGVWGSGACGSGACFPADPCAEWLWHQPLHLQGQPGSPPALESPEHGAQPLPLTGWAQHAPRARCSDAGGLRAARAVGASPSRSVPMGDLSSAPLPRPVRRLNHSIHLARVSESSFLSWRKPGWLRGT